MNRSITVYDFACTDEGSRVYLNWSRAGDIVSAGIYIWDSCELVHVNGKASAKSRDSHVHFDGICSHQKVRATTVLRDVHPVELISSIPESGFESISDHKEVKPIKANNVGEVSSSDDEHHKKVENAVSKANTVDESAGMFSPVCKLSHNKYGLVEIFANLVRI